MLQFNFHNMRAFYGPWPRGLGLKRDLSDSILSLFTKKWPWTICLGPSWQNSKCEQFAHAAHDKRAKGAICSFLRANHSFTHKKRANHWKNQWANSQPCVFNTQKWHVGILQMFFQRLLSSLQHFFFAR